MSAWRRLWNMLSFGTSSIVDDGGPVQKMQVRISPYELHDGTPNVQLFGLSANPPTGTDLVLIFPGGDRAAGVVVASNHQGSRPRDQAPGETTLFNNFGMTIALTANGIVINGGGKPIAIENSPTVTFGTTGSTTDLQVTGQIWHRYGSAEQVGVGTHTHTQPNDGHGDTEQPTNPPTAGT